MKQSEDLDKFNYILWIDLGYDGWHPKGFDTEESLLKEIAGETYGSDYIVTTPARIGITVNG